MNKIQPKQSLHYAQASFNQHKARLAKGLAAIALVGGMTMGGNYYIDQQMNEVYHVYVGNQTAGTVSEPEVVEGYILERYQALATQYPDVHTELNANEISYRAERAYKLESNDQLVLQRLDSLIQHKAYGVEIVIDGVKVGLVNNKETADAILHQIASKYLPQQKKSAVTILSTDVQENEEVVYDTVVSQEFVEQVDIRSTEIQPEDLMNPEEIVKLLETANIQPLKYTVQSGDCVGCIAQKFDLPIQLIYENNPWIKNDQIKVGDVMDLTMLQPALSVKVIEKQMEQIDVPFETVYEIDDNLRMGVIQPIKPGLNGLKQVVFHVTKVNGYIVEEEAVDEWMIAEPIAALARKGTKVILGEGSGKFAWPVLSARITSSYGIRWDKLHKGIDIVYTNKKIIAADHGEVIFAGNNKDGYGNKIIIDHKNGYRTVYAHLSKMNIARGKIVQKGDLIGNMGATGNATGVHLHFEIYKSNVNQNPMKFLAR
jgi:murein DD-endopeptidase MepM/ murein hydrolase activator NlpD